MATTVRLKACGGLPPYSWSSTGPVTLSNSTGVATTVACSEDSSTAVVVTLTDAVGVSVSQIIGGNCSCSGGCDINTIVNMVTSCPTETVTHDYIGDSLTGTINATHADCGSLGIGQDIAMSGTVTVKSGDTGAFAGQIIINATEEGTPDPVYYNLNASYGGASEGQPISGLALFVSATSTPCDFTGMVYLLDHKNNRSLIGYYVHGDLRTAEPTILISGGLPTGNYANTNFLLCRNCASISQPEASSTNDSPTVFLTVDNIGAVVPDIIPKTGNMGIIWCGNDAAGAHTASWDVTGWNWYVG